MCEIGARSTGPPSLEAICVSKLIAYRRYLGDVGDVPTALLQPVLLNCEAAELSSIEDDTWDGGSGRDLRAELQPHWKRVLSEKFPNFVKTSVDSIWWRDVFQRQEIAFQDKSAKINARTQERFAAHRLARQRRSVKVIAALPAARRKGQPSPSRSGVHPQPRNTRQSIMKKLKLGAHVLPHHTAFRHTQPVTAHVCSYGTAQMRNSGTVR